MVALTQLWLPILLSAVAVFIASSIVWMAMPHHRTDFQKPKDEEALLAAVRAQGSTGGQYIFPFCTHGEMKSPDAKARVAKGPWGSLIVLGGPPNMGKMLSLWFLHLLLVSIVVAYVASLGLAAGAAFQPIFRFTSAAAFLAYAGGAMPACIWKGEPKSNAWKSVFDGLAYALILGAIFGWLWPHAAA